MADGSTAASPSPLPSAGVTTAGITTAGVTTAQRLKSIETPNEPKRSARSRQTVPSEASLPSAIRSFPSQSVQVSEEAPISNSPGPSSSKVTASFAPPQADSSRNATSIDSPRSTRSSESARSARPSPLPSASASLETPALDSPSPTVSIPTTVISRKRQRALPERASTKSEKGSQSTAREVKEETPKARQDYNPSPQEIVPISALSQEVKEGTKSELLKQEVSTESVKPEISNKSAKLEVSSGALFNALPEGQSTIRQPALPVTMPVVTVARRGKPRKKPLPDASGHSVATVASAASTRVEALAETFTPNDPVHIKFFVHVAQGSVVISFSFVIHSYALFSHV